MKQHQHQPSVFVEGDDVALKFFPALFLPFRNPTNLKPQTLSSISFSFFSPSDLKTFLSFFFLFQKGGLSGTLANGGRSGQALT